MGISLFSFFSGSGIMDLAFENAGYEIVYVNEKDPDFLEAYKHARTCMNTPLPRYGYEGIDIREILKETTLLEKRMKLERERGNLVGFLGGPPCPDFSVAGKNRGFQGDSGQLTEVYFDLILKCEPDFFIFENVRGLVGTERHRHFYDGQKKRLGANGYRLSDQLLNALEFGAPQSRVRIFLVGVIEGLQIGVLNDGCLQEDDSDDFFDWESRKTFKLDEIMNAKWPKTHPFAEGNMRYYVYQKSYRELTVEHWFQKNDVSAHPNGQDCFKVKSGRKKIESIQEGDVGGKSFKRLHRHRFSPTVAYGNNEVHLHPYKARRLSVAEAMAIQSLPASFELPSHMSLSKKFKTIGNGVPYLMAYAIAQTLKQVLEHGESIEQKETE